MGLGAFNRMRMRQVEAMKADNIRKAHEQEKAKEKEVVETPIEYKQEEKTTLGPRKRKTDKE